MSESESEKVTPKRLTINGGLILLKALRGRLNDLKELRGNVAKVERWLGDTNKVNEPLYDVVEVDKKVARLQIVILGLETSIKEANAVTPINFSADVDKLLSPIESLGGC